jgi:hypothetical protein
MIEAIAALFTAGEFFEIAVLVLGGVAYLLFRDCPAPQRRSRFAVISVGAAALVISSVFALRTSASAGLTLLALIALFGSILIWLGALAVVVEPDSNLRPPSA